jgi:ssDNA-binding replication factor A large subunit
MANLSYEDIIQKIQEEKGISTDEIAVKIKEKLNQLSDLISKEGAAHIVANELGVKVYDAIQKAKRVKLNELDPTVKNVELAAKVTRLFEVRTFKTPVREGKVANMSIADETGFSRLVLWDENHIKLMEEGKIKEGDIILIKNGYIKVNNARNEVHLGGQGSLDVNPEGITIEGVKEYAAPEKKDIKDLAENDNATIVGTVVQIFEPRFYDSCPNCRKKVVQAEEGMVCPAHGKVESVPQAILNIVFDDGTENIRIVCFRENVNKVLELEDATVLRDNPDKFREVQRKVAGRQLIINGRINKNTFFDRLEMLANTVEEADPKQLAMELQK